MLRGKRVKAASTYVAILKFVCDPIISSSLEKVWHIMSEQGLSNMKVIVASTKPLPPILIPDTSNKAAVKRA